METIQIAAPDFELAKTLDSGQVFHWEQAGQGFVGTIGDLAVYAEQTGALLKAACPTLNLECKMHSRLEVLVSNYFALDHPLAEICASFPNDPTMDAAKGFCHGLRIIRQPKWECLATFICSSMKQVAHIRQISHKLRERFGDLREIHDKRVYTFPSAERIAGCSEKQLRECALGYRAKNLLATARQVASGKIDLEQTGSLSDAALHARLCELPGVGAKVANCVMLFAYERLRAFPIDVWIERVLRQAYFAKARKLNAKRLRAFTERYFGEHGGYAQQYLFHHARITGRRRSEKTGTARMVRKGRRQGVSLHDKEPRVK